MAQVVSKKIATHRGKAEIAPQKNQAVIRPAHHAFRWSHSTAWCTCGRWTLWNCSRDSGAKNHRLHMVNLPDRNEGRCGE